MALTDQDSATPEGAADDQHETRTTTDGGKTLSRGRDALARTTGPRLADFGVETGKALHPGAGRKGGKKGAGEAGGAAATASATAGAHAGTTTADEGAGDGSELPMFRPGMNWFVLRVASNKEDYVRETLLRKVQIEGMEQLVGRIMVPTEKTKTLKAGKQRITETKLYPGYVFVEMRLEADGRIPQDVFFLIKETTGVGDFVGTAGRPTPMGVPEVEKMLFDSRPAEETPQVKMEFAPGDPVTIKEGPFQNYEGTVESTVPDKGMVRVLVTIFGRQVPVEVEYWQVAKAGT
jgi:transcriptional antiterminator NusG